MFLIRLILMFSYISLNLSPDPHLFPTCFSCFLLSSIEFHWDSWSHFGLKLSTGSCLAHQYVHR